MQCRLYALHLRIRPSMKGYISPNLLSRLCLNGSGSFSYCTIFASVLDLTQLSNWYLVKGSRETELDSNKVRSRGHGRRPEPLCCNLRGLASNLSRRINEDTTEVTGQISLHIETAPCLLLVCNLSESWCPSRCRATAPVLIMYCIALFRTACRTSSQRCPYFTICTLLRAASLRASMCTLHSHPFTRIIHRDCQP